jgi:hypothetical protein
MSTELSTITLRRAGSFTELSDKDNFIYYSPKFKIFFYNTHIKPSETIHIEFQHISSDDAIKGSVDDRKFIVNYDLNRNPDKSDNDINYDMNTTNIILPPDAVNEMMMSFVTHMELSGTDNEFIKPLVKDLTAAIQQQFKTDINTDVDNEIITVPDE